MRNDSHGGKRGGDGLIMERSSLLQIAIITCNYCAPFHSIHTIIMQLSEWFNLVRVHELWQRGKEGSQRKQREDKERRKVDEV